MSWGAAMWKMICYTLLIEIIKTDTFLSFILEMIFLATLQLKNKHLTQSAPQHHLQSRVGLHQSTTDTHFILAAFALIELYRKKKVHKGHTTKSIIKVY